MSRLDRFIRKWFKSREDMEDLVEGSTEEVLDEVISMLNTISGFLRGMERSEIQSVIDALEGIRGSSHNALGLPDAVLDISVKIWLKQTMEAAEVKGHVEEDFILKLSQIRQELQLGYFRSRANQPVGSLYMSYNLASNNSLPLNIKATGQTYNSRERLGISRLSIVDQNSEKLFYSFIDEYVDSAAKDLMVSLTEGAPARSVISLVGPSGIGKTTLAKKVYNCDVAGDYFDCCAWINVSGSYLIKELLKDMIMQINQAGKHGAGGLDEMRTMELFGSLRQSLQSKRYLFVFDDVSQDEFWHVIKQGLPDNKKGSRIIIITRSDSVVACCKESSFDQVHKLGPLSDAISWELFCRIAFHDELERCCPPELDQLSCEIVKMCRGFPLPIVSIAGLLSTKDKTVAEWKKLHDNFSLEVKSNLRPLGVSEVLALSLCDLPGKLMTCFLYFSIFPEDTLIANDKLIKLWIAEGFVEEKIGKTLEDVAEEYLNELIHKNLVQACQGFYGLEQFCKVHRLMHNIAKAKALELDFCCFGDDKKLNIQRNICRLSISNNVDILENNEESQVHSVFLFNTSALTSSFLVTLFEKCKLLTLLDIDTVPIDYLPEELGNLSRLTYLSLKNTKVKMLPKSLYKLYLLQTLDIRNTLLTELPIEINRFRNLRHLLASVSGDSSRGLRMKRGIWCLENLHTLMTVDAHLSGIDVIKELVKLQRLRRLGISGVTVKVSTALCTCIEAIKSLESLSLQSRNSYEILNLESISSPPPPLQDLVLKGPLQKIPDWIIRLQNLSMLCLSLSRLNDDPLIHLSHLPNLVSLWLYWAYEGENLHFGKGGFERLKLLVLSKLDGLNAVEIEEGALPLLEELRIGPAPLLDQVPSGIQHLQNLKVLANFDMRSKFVLSMQPDGGSDYWKVEHIPSVLFWYRVHGRSYMLYKLGDSDLLDHLQGLARNTNIAAQHRYDLPLSLCYSDDEEGDEVAQLSFSAVRSIVQQNSISQWSFSSGFYTDDLEE